MNSFFSIFFCNSQTNQIIVTIRIRVEQHYRQSEDLKKLLINMNLIFTAMFSLECILKIIAYGFKVTKSHLLLLYSCLTNSLLHLFGSVFDLFRS